jgi:ribonuclease D
MKASMNPPKLIETQAELNEFVKGISETAHLAVDSEANSFYAYKPKVCLIQVSSDHKDYILDPLALKDLTPFGRVLADPSVEKILHAAENDLLGFKRDFRFSVKNIFDTSVACRILGLKRLGLARILSEEFGVNLDKKFQRYNWERRPLSPEPLYYAQLDTHLLIKLRHRLHARLLERDLLDQALSSFARLEQIRIRPARAWQPDDYRYIRGAQDLPVASLSILKALFAYRENLARRFDKAPFRIMNNDFMVRVAREMPTDRAALARIRGLPPQFKGKGAHKLLRVIKRSLA